MAHRVLIVEDDRQWRRILARYLRSKYDVDVAASLQEALQLIASSEPYHVVITDIALAEDNEHNTDGLVLLRKVHEWSPATSTIAISGRAAQPTERFTAEYHTLAYLDRSVLDRAGAEDEPGTLLFWVARGIAESGLKGDHRDGA